MIRAAVILAFVGGVTGLVSAQAPAPASGPAFEVASIKPAGPASPPADRHQPLRLRAEPLLGGTELATCVGADDDA